MLFPSRATRLHKILIVLAIVALHLPLLLLFSFVHRLLADPDTLLLVSEEGAQWIRFREAPYLMARDLGDFQTNFRTDFNLDTLPSEAVLTLRALRLARLSLNGKILLEKGTGLHQWKTPSE